MCPQGYLTLDPNSPIILRDVSGSTVYYVPAAAGYTVPIVGACGDLHPVSIIPSPLAAPPSLDISGLPAGSMHDIYAIDNSGFALCRVPWARRPYGSETYGSDVYGQGPVLDASYYGLPVNGKAMVGYLSNGSSVSVDQYRGTHLGSICISADAGVIKCLGTYGLSREWGVWNAHQQRTINLRAGTPTFRWLTGPTQTHDGYTIGSQTEYSPEWGPVFGDPANSAKIFTGRPVRVEASWFEVVWRAAMGGHNAILSYAIGWNSTTQPSGQISGFDIEGYTGPGYIAIGESGTVSHTALSGPGVSVATMLIQTNSVVKFGSLDTGSIIAIGSRENAQLLSAKWMG